MCSKYTTSCHIVIMIYIYAISNVGKRETELHRILLRLPSLLSIERRVLAWPTLASPLHMAPSHWIAEPLFKSFHLKFIIDYTNTLIYIKKKFLNIHLMDLQLFNFAISLNNKCLTEFTRI